MMKTVLRIALRGWLIISAGGLLWCLLTHFLGLYHFPGIFFVVCIIALVLYVPLEIIRRSICPVAGKDYL